MGSCSGSDGSSPPPPYSGHPGRKASEPATAPGGISMMIPLPGTNALPAKGMFLRSLGLLEHDGWINLCGWPFVPCWDHHLGIDHAGDCLRRQQPARAHPECSEGVNPVECSCIARSCIAGSFSIAEIPVCAVHSWVREGSLSPQKPMFLPCPSITQEDPAGPQA